MPDNESKINCPACGKIMHKIYMPAQNVNLDVCLDGCGGIYFDNREFKMFEKPYDDIAPLIEAYKDKTFKKVNEDELRICPACGMKMVKNYSSARRNVKIDECYGCGARFLDYEELEKIRYGSAAERYDKRPVVIPSNFYQELQADENPAENFEEINSLEFNTPEFNIPETNTPEFNEYEFDNSRAYQDSAPLYVLNEREIQKHAVKKGLIFGLITGLIFSFLFFEKFNQMFPVILEFAPEADKSSIELIYFLICLFVFSITGIVVSKYIHSKITNHL